MATRLMTWRRRGLLFVIGAALALSAIPAAAQTDVYGPSVSTDREDEIALLGVTWGSDAFYKYMIENASSPQPSPDTSWANGVVDDEPWLGN